MSHVRIAGEGDVVDFTEKEYYDRQFQGLKLENEELTGIDFEECAFEECSFLETQFAYCRFLHCTFTRCHLNLIRVANCSFSNTNFEDSQVIGVNWTEASWPKRGLSSSIDFSRCVLNHSTFSGLTLRKIRLVGSLAKDVDFSEADLTQGDFRDSDFAQSRFAQTNLTKADFRGARNYEIAADHNTLKQSRFSLPEAMSLLYGLDIILEE